MANFDFDTLSDEDLDVLETSLTQKTIISGKGSDADALSKLVKDAPQLGKQVTLYRHYTASTPAPTLEKPLYHFTEKGFLAGSTRKPPKKDGAVVFAFKLPAGVKALKTSEDTYLLDRGLEVYYTTTSEGEIPATIGEAFKNGKALTAAVAPLLMRFTTGYVPPLADRGEGVPTVLTCPECGEVSLANQSVEEFFNKCHGPRGRFCRNGGGSRGKAAGQGQAQKTATERAAAESRLSRAEKRLQKTANVLRAITTILGVVVTIAAVSSAVDTLVNRKAIKRDKANIREERDRKFRPGPDFGGDKDSEAIYKYLNPAGKRFAGNPNS